MVRRPFVVGLAVVALTVPVALARADLAPDVPVTRAAAPAAATVAATAAAAAPVITGTVRAADTGRGLAEAQVVAFSAAGGTWSAGDDDGTFSMAMTDEKGAFRLPKLRTGVEYRILVVPRPGSAYVPSYAPGTQHAAAAALVAAPGRVVVRLPRGQVVTGRLLDPKGRPADRGHVSLVGADDAELQGSGTTDAKGRWRATVVPGRYLVTAFDGEGLWWAPGVDDVRKATVLTVRAGRATPALTVRTPKPALVDTTVVDAPTRASLPEACAEEGYREWDPAAEGPGGLSLGWSLSFSVADGDPCDEPASHRVVQVDPDSGLVRASAPGHVDTTVKAPGVRRGVTVPLTIALPVAGTITGRVLGADGKPALGCVEAEDVDAPARLFPADVDCGLDRGAFTLEGLAPGRYRVRASGEGVPDRYAPDADDAASATVYTVTAGTTTPAGTVRLRRGGVLKGRVLDTAGHPVVGATVVVPGATWWQPALAGTFTDAAGRYTLTALPAGATRVRVVPSQRSGLASQWLGGAADETRAATVPVRLGSTSTAPDLRLPRGATLRVKVGPAGKAPVMVEAFDAQGRETGDLALVGKDGIAVLTGLPATAVRVHAESSSVLAPKGAWLGGTSFKDAKGVALRAGRTTTVTLALRPLPAATAPFAGGAVGTARAAAGQLGTGVLSAPAAALTAQGFGPGAGATTRRTLADDNLGLANLLRRLLAGR